MNRTEEFQELRPLLFSIAYRLLGSVAEAEDAVQEAWLRFESAATEPRSAKAYLSAVVTRISIHVSGRRASGGSSTSASGCPSRCWTIPSRIRPALQSSPTRCPWRRCGSSSGFLARTSRVRAARGVRLRLPRGGRGGRTLEAACRQLAVRVGAHMDAGRPRFEADHEEREALAARFFGAFRDGDVDGLKNLLAADVTMVGAAEGKAPALARSVFGADKAARLLASISPGLRRSAWSSSSVRSTVNRARSSATGRQGGQHVRAGRARRADPDDPLGRQPRQASARGPGRGRLGPAARVQADTQGLRAVPGYRVRPIMWSRAEPGGRTPGRDGPRCAPGSCVVASTYGTRNSPGSRSREGSGHQGVPPPTDAARVRHQLEPGSREGVIGVDDVDPVFSMTHAEEVIGPEREHAPGGGRGAQTGEPGPRVGEVD